MNDQGPARHAIAFGTPTSGNARDMNITVHGGTVAILFDKLGAMTDAKHRSASHAAEVTIPIESASDNAHVLIEMRGHASRDADADVLLIAHDGRSEQSLRFDGEGDFYSAWHCPVCTGVPLRLSLLVAARAGIRENSVAIAAIDSIEISPGLSGALS